MKISLFENTSNPEIYLDIAQTQIIHSTLYKIGRSECIKLINDIYNERLKDDGSAIQLKFINQGFSNTVVLRIYVGDIKGEALKIKKRYILKIGKFDDVNLEFKNYSENMALNRPDYMPALITFIHILERWAAILYEDLGEIRTFQDFYLEEDNDLILTSSMNTLLKKLENDWYKNSFIGYTNMYYEQYNLIQSVGKYQNAIKSLFPRLYNRERISISIQGKEFILKNPIYFLLEKKNSKSIVTQLSVVHGDFHGANILIDQGKDAVYVIDFANMQTDGQIFKDYVKLESNIIYRLFDYDFSKMNPNPKSSWYELLAYSLGYDIPLPDEAEEAKAWKCICELRNRAFDLKTNYFGSSTWQDEYLVGVLHWTLSSIYWIDIFNSKKVFAFYSAALICNAIEKGLEIRKR